MSLTAQDKLHLKKIIRELKSHKAPHTEFVSVYVPKDYDLTKIINHLAEEQGTAANIKSAVTRKNVQNALEKMIQHLRTIGRTPANGLAVFAGNVAAAEGKQDLRAWSIEPPVPLNIRIYRCDKQFVTDILEDMMAEHRVYGLVVFDRRDAIFALLKGKTIIPLQKTHSEVPGKFKAGGQCHVFGTLIQSSTGNILKIEKSHNPLVVKSMVMDNYSIQDSPITDKWTVQKQEVYKIKTKYPQLIVESSKEHVFFVMTSEGIIEKSAEELQIGDTLLMPEKIEINGRKQKINSRRYYNSFVINKEGQEVLKNKRSEKGLLQRELAKRIHVTQTTISSYEIGKLHIDKEPLQKLCVEFNLDFEEFLETYCQHFHHQGTSVRLPEELTEEFAQFLGYYIGDGCMEIDRVTFFEQRKEVALAYKNLFDDFFNIDSSYKFRESKNYHQLKFTSRPLVRLINGEFPEIKKTLDTEIPKKVLESEKKIIAKFLRGYFDAEGYVTPGSVGIGANNKTLIGQTQLLLLRFSIIASYLEYDNRSNPYSKNPIFKLQINEKESLIRFKELVGFTSTEKSQRLEKLIQGKTDKSSVRQILAPGTQIRKIIEKSGYNTQLFPKVNGFFRNERMMSKQAFKASILAYVKDKNLYKQLEEIHNSQILPVKIANIEKRNENVEMVDISVGNQNFIANGVIVHNSAHRFAQIREESNKQHAKKVADYMKEQFLPLGTNLKGIIIGGPGITINDFMNYDYVTGELKKKILGTKDLSYTGEEGLQELLDRAQDLLAAEEIAEEKSIMNRFFQQMRENMRKVTYGEKATLKALDMNSVDVLLLSESLSEDRIFELEDLARKGGATVKVISVETREGVQLKDLGGVAAILRFEVE
ncbi:helix-turn-helix domain-containing protein [Candidatus Woesearchaeota archaeon]|nr:helix-turn-helix domain-containing protein [Candidatus Woesearchaeota archaeon]